MNFVCVQQIDLSGGSCAASQAYSTDLCNKAGINTIILAITVGRPVNLPCRPVGLIDI